MRRADLTTTEDYAVWDGWGTHGRESHRAPDRWRRARVVSVEPVAPQVPTRYGTRREGRNKDGVRVLLAPKHDLAGEPVEPFVLSTRDVECTWAEHLNQADVQAEWAHRAERAQQEARQRRAALVADVDQMLGEQGAQLVGARKVLMEGGQVCFFADKLRELVSAAYEAGRAAGEQIKQAPDQEEA